MDNAEQMIEYHEAYREFLDAMNRLQNEKDDSIKLILEKLCNKLKVAKMVTTFYETPAKEAVGQGSSLLLYGKEDYKCSSPKICHRNMTGGGNVVVYETYSYEEEPWNEWEKKEIETLMDTIFAYHGRIRTMRIAERLTFWDSELDLPNLKYFMREVGTRIKNKQIFGYVSCYYNLKRFSVINDLIGRNAGTVVMTAYARQLKSIIEPDGFVAHVGGDNFVTLFKEDKLETVRKYFYGTPVVYNETTGESVVISASAGFNVISEDRKCTTPSDVMEGAFLSANLAKHNGQSDEIFWNDEIKEKQMGDKKIENIFPEALEKGEFKVYYQPKFSLEGEYHLVGAEALCRWFHDGRKFYPDEFIPVLERSVNICKLDFYVLEQVCKDIRRWLDEGKEVVKVSVNLSRKHLVDRDLLKHIMEIIDRNKVPHEYIEIELTETTTDVDFKDLKRVANGLHEQNISISVDDFGMGYSSLNLIRDVSWDVLKIDKSFLPENDDTDKKNNRKNIMLRYVISMARELGMECIVEGVETENHVKLLKKNNCFLAQGFYFDRPLPLDEFEKRLLAY